MADNETIAGVERTLSGKKPDFTVTEAGIRTTWEHKESKGFILTWGTKSAGFGELTIYQLEDGTLKVDTEAMGPAFCKEVLEKLFDQAYHDGPWPSSFQRNTLTRLHSLFRRPAMWGDPETVEALGVFMMETLLNYDVEDFKKKYTDLRQMHGPSVTALHQNLGTEDTNESLALLTKELQGLWDQVNPWPNYSVKSQ